MKELMADRVAGRIDPNLAHRLRDEVQRHLRSVEFKMKIVFSKTAEL